MLIILLLFAPENDGGINCESEDIYERVQSNFFAVMARAVNFKRWPKGVCLHAAANNNGKKYTARTLARIVNISVAADRRKDKIIQKGLVHHQHTGFGRSTLRAALGARPATELGHPVKELCVLIAPRAPSASARMIN